MSLPCVYRRRFVRLSRSSSQFSALIPTSLNMNMFQQNGASGCVSVSDFDGQFWRLMYHFSKATGGQTRAEGNV